MAIKRSKSGSKVSASFSSSSMTDLVFLLLVFFVLATTLINPIQTLQVTLPTSDADGESDSSVAAIEVVGEANDYDYILNAGTTYETIDDLRGALEAYYGSSDMASKESKTMHVSLYCDRSKTTVQGFVDVATMIQEINKQYIAKGNKEDKFKLVLATKEAE